MPCKIQVLDVSHRKTEPNGFRMLREKGQDAILFLHFFTPVSIVIDGETTNTARNACIIYTPGIRQDYGAQSDTAHFENNYITFKTSTADFLAKCKVIVNEPFYINNEDEITRRIEQITWAQANRLQPLEHKIERWVHELFQAIEQGTLGTNPKSLRDIQVKQRFITLRGEVSYDPRSWTVEKMAAACWLTRSRFYVLYKSFFGVSPSDDLAAITMEYAKDRLVNTQDSIGDIALDCGYKRPESFIRMFSEKEGTSPGQYRRDKT